MVFPIYKCRKTRTVEKREWDCPFQAVCFVYMWRVKLLRWRERQPWSWKSASFYPFTMGDETWANIQLLKSNRERFREKIKKRKAERETLLSSVVGGGSSSSSPSTFLPPTTSPTPLLPGNKITRFSFCRVKSLVILQESSVWMIFFLYWFFIHIGIFYP